MIEIKSYSTLNQENIDECNRKINESENIIISTHINPDGDAIGSALAMYYHAKSLGKNADVIIHGPIPFNLEAFVNSENCQIYDEARHRDKILNAGLIMIVDLNDSNRLKTVEKDVLESKAYKIVIDHHIDPKEFADLYLVDTDACSAGEIIWKIINRDNKFRLSREIADALYLAIMTDTGSFRFPRTDSEVHSIIAKLLDAGADPVEIYEEVYNKNPFRSMKLLGEAFAGMELYNEGQFCLMSLKKEHFDRTGAIEDDVEGFVEESLHVKGVKMGILMTEIADKKEIRVSFRSKGDINVRELALEFGGGGHHHAAGARIYDTPFDTAKEELIKKVAVMVFGEREFNEQ